MWVQSPLHWQALLQDEIFCFMHDTTGVVSTYFSARQPNSLPADACTHLPPWIGCGRGWRRGTGPTTAESAAARATKGKARPNRA